MPEASLSAWTGRVLEQDVLPYSEVLPCMKLPVSYFGCRSSELWQHPPMKRIDWMLVLSIVVLIISLGAICILLFAV